MTEQVLLRDLYPVIAEVMASGGEFTFSPSGESMRPMLLPEDCSVTIAPPCGRLSKYDLPLYRLPDGRFVLHRVIGVLPDGYVCRGDAVVAKERGILDSQIVGVMVSFERRGKKYPAASPMYRLYARVWTALPFLRRFVLLGDKLKRKIG
ncbi:MAG: hypothetical protein IKT81_03160 [Clostridia bacterium]|nr:hypothetical protein [Clostridia bacterium]